MTREEYERLLKSDYWKGYSYSLIKERNFTCEDCGRRFYNERNKLQVHHLVYRDVNPWSYRPDELVVLCEECHQRRHGILQEPMRDTNNTFGQDVFREETQSYSSSPRINDEKPHYYSEAERWGEAKSVNERSYNNSRYPYPEETQNQFRLKFKYVIYGFLFLLALSFGMNKLFKQKSINGKDPINETVEQSLSNREKDNLNIQQDNQITSDKIDVDEFTEESRSTPATIPQEENFIADYQEPESRVKESNSTRNKSEEELTTLEILERRNHANAVKIAQRAGVSTEGSTMDILDRINHANAVKSAQRAGVSTEGSTMDILDRINHANAVKSAQRAGVSTEGSTMDILDRINRKELEKYAQ